MPSQHFLVRRRLFPLAAVASGIALASSGRALAQANPLPTEDLSAILHSFGTGTQTDLENYIGTPPRASVLNYVSNVIENRRFTGTISDLTPQDRLAVLSDDGSTVYIRDNNTGTTQTYVSRFGRAQSIEGANGLSSTLSAIPFTPTAGATYTISVDYSNTVHINSADLDGVTLFRYRLPSVPTQDFTPRLRFDGVTAIKARLVWDKLPSEYTSAPGFAFAGYDLFASSDGNFAPDATPFWSSPDVNATSHEVAGLSSNTRYFYKLRVRYSIGNPAQAKAPESNVVSLKTARDTYKVTFAGDKRAAAGGRYLEGAAEKQRADEAHTATVSATIEKKAPNNTLALQKDTLFRLRLSNNEGSEGAQFITTDAAGAADYTSGPIEVSTNAQGQLSVRVLSSRKVGSATVVVQENTGTPEAPVWEDAADTGVEFAPAESKRLFGIKEWNQTYADDTGWEFSPTAFTTPATAAPQVMTCRLYLRFRKDTNEAIVDRGYFIAGDQKFETLNANGDATVSAAEFAAREASGSPTAPLVNSTEAQPRRLWLPLNGHKLRVRIQSVGTTADDMMVASVPKSSRVAAFSNAAGEYAVVGAGDAVTYQVVRPALPEYLPVETRIISINGQSIEGVAEFHIRAGYLAHRVNQIRFSVEDVTTK
jgi:hypothetical protein